MWGKLNDNDFLRYIHKYDFICLTETFVEKLDFVHSSLRDYVCFLTPAIKLSHQGRPSGGVMILVRQCFEHKVKHIASDCDNLVTLLVDKSVFGSARDLCLCATYIPPYDSPYYTHMNVESDYLFESAQNAIADVLATAGACSVVLCGDMNSRTANFSSLSIDPNDDGFEDIVYETDRISQDTKLNAFGEKLLELCSTFDLRILNGLIDAASGSFTYVCQTGASVVDYFLLSDDLLDTKPVMAVGDCHVSKHFPLELSLVLDSHVSGVQGNVDEGENISYEKLFWNSDQQDSFLDRLAELEFFDKLERLLGGECFDVDVVVDMINRGLLAGADLFKKTV